MNKNNQLKHSLQNINNNKFEGGVSAFWYVDIFLPETLSLKILNQQNMTQWLFQTWNLSYIYYFLCVWNKFRIYLYVVVKFEPKVLKYLGVRKVITFYQRGNKNGCNLHLFEYYHKKCNHLFQWREFNRKANFQFHIKKKLKDHFQRLFFFFFHFFSECSTTHEIF